jgi:hypothetical protein
VVGFTYVYTVAMTETQTLTIPPGETWAFQSTDETEVSVELLAADGSVIGVASGPSGRLYLTGVAGHQVRLPVTTAHWPQGQAVVDLGAPIPRTEGQAFDLAVGLDPRDRWGNVEREHGVDRCYCGSKYWEHDRCIDCGGTEVES